MRRILISLGAASFCISGFLAACSSDDSAGTTAGDAGSDSAADTFVPPQDSGTPDTGADAGSGCQTCSDFLENGPGSVPLCTTGSPSSADLVDRWFNGCVCNGDGGASCITQCADTCSTFAAPTADCQTCFSTTCATSLAACAADGADGGPIVDASDDGG